LTVNGTTTGTGELVMDGTGTLSGSGTITKLRIQTAGTITSDNATVAELTMSSGTVNITANRTLHVLTDASFLGGTLNGGAGSVVDVDGDVDFNGTLAGATPPALRVAGSYSSNLPFHPGLVIFDTSNLHVIDSNPPVATVRIDDIQLQGGTLRLGNAGGLQVVTISIAAGAIFEVPSGVFTMTPVAMSISGELRLLAGADLSLGNNSSVTVNVGGAFSLLGAAGARAVVRGLPLSRWRTNVSGTLRGREFELRDLDAYRSPVDRGGVRLLSGATLGAPPLDFSDGVLAGSSTDPNGALLWLQNGTSLDFFDLTFTDTGAIPFKGAATAALAPTAYRLFRYDGNLGGASFEEDPNGVISWLDAGRTALSSSSAVSGLQRIDLAFETSQEIDTTAFELWRRTVQGGAATFVASVPAAGSSTAGASYAFADLALLDTSRYYYEIDDVRPGRPVRRLGEVSGRPWQAQTGNAFFVGNGGFTDVATALAAAPDGATIVLGAGTHAAFTLDRPMRIVGAEAGQVLIDTTSVPMVVRDQFVFEGDVALYDLTIGSATSPFGLELVNCDNVIVLDGIEAHSQGTGLLVDDCPRVALQSVLCRGATSLSITNGSTVFLTRGDVPTMQVANFSQVQHAGLLLGTSTPDGTSTIQALPGVSPRVDFPLLWSGLQTYEVTVDAAPGDFFALYLATGRFFFDFSPFVSVDSVALVDPGMATVFVSGIVGPGSTQTLQLQCPEFTYAWGGAVSLQVLSLRLSAPRPFVLGNVRDIFLVP
ncbi:MAG: hypothetical protein ABL982_20770, partial [Vicinamibacterales bacterium]